MRKTSAVIKRTISTLVTPRQISQSEITRMFPRASRSVLEANCAVTLPAHHTQPVPAAVVKPIKSRMNRTESDYALILEAMKRKGDIVDYQFEGLTIRLADNCRYTPDFFILVSLSPLSIRFVETKGAHIWDDSKVKFRVAKEQNPWAEWEMHQRTKGSWTRIL